MKKTLITLALASVCSVVGSVAFASDDDRNVLVRFDGGIGSQPFAAGAGGVPVANDVKGIAPGGRPWPIGDLSATVRVDGTISVKGKGMILGGGANVGRPAIPRQVVATLFCGNDAFNSAPTALDAAGDFKINGALTPVAPNVAPVPPNPCTTSILLIRNFGGTPAAAGPWFAAGIPVPGSNDD